MTKNIEHDGDDNSEATIKDVIGHLKQNILDSAKAHELRTKELTAILGKCESGELSLAAALELSEKHHERWGEALRGARAYPDISDEKIIKIMDEVRQRRSDPDWVEKFHAAQREQSKGR